MRMHQHLIRILRRHVVSAAIVLVIVGGSDLFEMIYTLKLLRQTKVTLMGKQRPMQCLSLELINT